MYGNLKKNPLFRGTFSYYGVVRELDDVGDVGGIPISTCLFSYWQELNQRRIGHVLKFRI